MTNILVLNWRDIKNPDAGGAEFYTHEIFTRIAQRTGNQVTLLTSSFESAKGDEYLDGIHVIRRGGKYSVYSEARRFYEEKHSQFDVVIDEINTRPFMTPRYVRDMPIIGLIHQLARQYWWYETRFPINVLGYYYFERRWLKEYFDLPVVTVSESSASEMREFGFHRLYTIQNGVSVQVHDRRDEKADQFTATFLARMKKVKRPEDSIRGFLKSHQSSTGILRIAGEGPLKKKLQSAYADKVNVKFLGRISQTEKIDLLRSSHLHLAPYLKEGWGNTVIEAAALGTPTIGYKTTGLVDSVVDGKTGFLVSQFNLDEMAQKIDYLASNPDALNTMSKNCIEFASRFSWERSSTEFNDLIKRVLQG